MALKTCQMWSPSSYFLHKSPSRSPYSLIPQISKLLGSLGSSFSFLFFFLHCPLFREGCEGSSSRLSRHTSRSYITSFISLGWSPKDLGWNLLKLHPSEMKDVMEDREVWQLNLELLSPQHSRKSGQWRKKKKEKEPSEQFVVKFWSVAGN